MHGVHNYQYIDILIVNMLSFYETDDDHECSNDHITIYFDKEYMRKSLFKKRKYSAWFLGILRLQIQANEYEFCLCLVLLT